MKPDDPIQAAPDAGEPAVGDPFEAFNRAQGIGSVRDPYPRLGELRRQCPVHKLSARELFGDKIQVPLDLGDVYTVFSHDAVSEVLRDGQTFSSTGYAKTMGIVMGHSILEMDEPEHSQYRGLIQQAFSRKALARWETDLVAPIVHEHVDRFAGRGSADLVRELTFPFPVRVIAGMLGLPATDLSQFHRWAVELISISINPARGMQASQNLRDYFASLLPERRREPKEDLISVLAQAELDGTKLTDEEIFAFLRLLLPAGAETTYRSSSNLLFGLLTHPDQLAAVTRDRSLLPQAIEEGLRWEPPLLGILRTATRDTELGGVKIPAEALVSVNVGAACRDDTRFEQAEAFDIFRPPQTHMAFAFGAHRCLGMHLARMETRVVLDAVLDRLPDLRLDPEAKDTHISGLIFRCPQQLPVLFG